MNISVIGIGGIGGILAALLAKNGYVTSAITSQNSVQDIKKNGLKVSSSHFGTFKSYPQVKTVIDDTLDIVFFTTKYPFLANSLSRLDLKKMGNPVFISLLNGLGSRELIMNKVGKNFITGSIGSIEVFRDEDGVIQQPLDQAPFINLAKETYVKNKEFDKVIEVLQSIGINTNVFNNCEEVIWKKLVRLGAIASTTAAFQLSIGQIREDNYMREILIGLIQEGAKIARSYGVNANEVEEIKHVDQLPYSLRSSLSRDISARKPSELDSITKAIIDKAKEQSLSVPIYEFIFNLINKNYE